MQAGVEAVILHGCAGPGCSQVWTSSTVEEVCPQCGRDRFNEKGEAHEEIIWFPLASRLQALFKCQQFVEAVRHELRRPRVEADIVSDVFDCKVWHQLMGPTTPACITRIGMLLCMDGFPAFNEKHKGSPSLMPAEFMILSLPPHMRYNPDNMLVWLLVPHNMSAEQQQKYFKYCCDVELNPLQSTGIPGPDGPVKVKLFGASLDLKGKEKFYNMESVIGYCSCSTCHVHFDQGPKGPIFCCARRFLPRDHPLRAKSCQFAGVNLSFAKEENRPAPPTKTTQTIFNALAMLREREVEHYLGIKGPPMLLTLKNFRYEWFNTLEWMHNLKCAFDNFLNLLVGKINDNGKWDMKARQTSKILGVFPALHPDRVVYLSAVRHRVLARMQDHNINRAGAPWIRRWLKLCGITMPKQARVDELRTRLKELRNIAKRGEPVPVLGARTPLPWRLSTEARCIVNGRAVGLCYPHYTPVCHIGKDSFVNRAGCWRSASKLLAFLVILIPILRGFVPDFFEGLRRVIHGLRILKGQTCSANEAKKLKLKFDHIYLRNSHIDKARLLLLTGLAIIEGCCPICLLVPALHCLCHYGDGAALWGLLWLLWMFCFERFNKKCKNMTANKLHPFKSLSNSMVRDATARYYRWRRGQSVGDELEVRKTQLCGREKGLVLNRAISSQVNLRCGCRVQHSSVVSFAQALISGKRFHAGEPLIESKRCGSVIVRTIRGRSVYGLVKKFVRILCRCNRCREFVVVTWLPRPVYPDGDPLTVKINMGGKDFNNMGNETICSLDDIQPSRIIVSIDRKNDCLYMMRVEGYDIVV